MLDFFFVTFPFFFLVFAGYFAVSKGLLTVSAVPGLNSFVLYFALTCMCFRIWFGDVSCQNSGSSRIRRLSGKRTHHRFRLHCYHQAGSDWME